jgi:hypothetical protein
MFNEIYPVPVTEIPSVEPKFFEKADFSDVSNLKETEVVEKFLNYLENLEEIKVDNWEHLTLDERVNTLQEIENYAAQIENRPAMNVISEKYDNPGLQGYFSYQDKLISISEEKILSNDISELRDTLNTIAHEGRHAYQYYNLFEQRIEESDEKFLAWKTNIEEVGYMASDKFGFELYYTQPVEVDARIFAEAVTKNLNLR